MRAQARLEALFRGARGEVDKNQNKLPTVANDEEKRATHQAVICRTSHGRKRVRFFDRNRTVLERLDVVRRRPSSKPAGRGV